MTNRKAPYSHADGSNCWTHDCSRRGGAEVIAHNKTKYVSSFVEEELFEKARFQNAFDDMQMRIAEREKATAEQAEKMRLEHKAKMEDMLPLLKKVPNWEDELDGDWDYDEEDDYEDDFQKLNTYQDNAYMKASMELEEYMLLSKQETPEGDIKTFPISWKGSGGLYSSLCEAERIAFENLPHDSSFRRKYQYLVASGELMKVREGQYADWMEARSERLSERIYECIQILNDVREYSSGRKSRFEEYRLGRRIKNLNEEAAEIFSGPLSKQERDIVFDRKWNSTPSKPTVVNVSLAHSAFRSAFGSGETQRPTISASAQNPGAWLSSAFPEVSREYNKTEELLKTANTMKQGIEDEYFVEQVSANYYPAIHRSLKAVSGKDVSPSHREAVIGETKVQLALIQDGLQKIIDNNVSRSVQETKAQTEFLRAKMGQNNPELDLPVQLPTRLQ